MTKKKLIALIMVLMALFFTILAIRFAWFMIRGNEAINYAHIAIPTILGALCVKEYRTLKKAENKTTE